MTQYYFSLARSDKGISAKKVYHTNLSGIQVPQYRAQTFIEHQNTIYRKSFIELTGFIYITRLVSVVWTTHKFQANFSSAPAAEYNARLYIFQGTLALDTKTRNEERAVCVIYYPTGGRIHKSRLGRSRRPFHDVAELKGLMV